MKKEEIIDKAEEFVKCLHYPVARSKKEAVQLIIDFYDSIASELSGQEDNPIMSAKDILIKKEILYIHNGELKFNEDILFRGYVRILIEAMHDFASQSQQKAQQSIMDKILGNDNPWPLKDVLNKLIEASEILLHEKNYDRHGWEEISRCVKRGKEIVSILVKTNYE